MISPSNLAGRFWQFIADAGPWLQGLFGGAGALLLWEAILKPRRERHALAHVLAEEAGYNLQYAVQQRLYLNHNPKAVPMDFELSEIVFSAVGRQVGELRPLVAEIMLVYRQIQAMNRLPADFKETLVRYQAERAIIPDLADSVRHQQRLREFEHQLDAILHVYSSGLESLVDRLNKVLPKLRRASYPWWRLDYLVRRKTFLNIAAEAEKVAALAAQRQRELRETGP